MLKPDVMATGQMEHKQLLPIEFLPIGIVIVEAVHVSKMLFTLGRVRWIIVKSLAAAEAKVMGYPVTMLIGIFNRNVIRSSVFIDCVKEDARGSGACEAGTRPVVWGKMPQVRVLYGGFQVTEAYVTNPAPVLVVCITNSVEAQSLCLSKLELSNEGTGWMWLPINEI